ncbi:glycosyltransferase family 2 protein [Lentilitoribacter sp. Alg239-R112]|uniref:glycosyltransferase n=1 Tax=Lentilitoribacter sp. Alg239-R112 TaxID=2305987 RepID=UPI0013A6D3FE|nr:glycosyltransferase family 2 protein [Lentilitoribacter sp. Alg239-R112]
MTEFSSGMILIPTYQPEENLLGIIDDLLTKMKSLDDSNSDVEIDLGQVLIIVVNDGSTSKGANKLFREIAGRNNVFLINHTENKGKGAALKTGIQYALEHNASFLVTADADGQHLPNDIVKIFRHPGGEALIVGSRIFDQDVPLRSRFGNILTRVLFKILFRTKVSDTQSGLRKISRTSFEKYLSIGADGYQFELEALITSSKEMPIIEVPIETVYEPGNPTSHFNPIWDSAQIYFVLFRSVISSLIIAVFDIALFSLLTFFDVNTFTAILINRSILTILYFNLGKKFIFISNGNRIKEFFKLVVLIIVNAILLTPVIEYVVENSDINKPLIYAVASTLLFLLNFWVQKFIVFRKGENDDRLE